MFKRIATLPDVKRHSCFLWGPRQTGKSTLLRRLFPKVPYYDLLLADEFERLTRRPSAIREELLANPPLNLRSSILKGSRHLPKNILSKK